MGVDELVLLDLLLFGSSTFRGFDLYQFSQSGFFCHILDISVDDLVFKVGELVVILFQDGFQS